jgi:predicted Zn-dependent protease with MMP-like domain
VLCALCPLLEGGLGAAPREPGAAVRFETVTSSSESPSERTRRSRAAINARARRRDRHGRGLRGRLVPPHVPLYRSRAQLFDDLVLEAVARLEPRWEAELSDVEFAVQEVPDAEFLTETGLAEGGVPLARIVRGSGESGPVSGVSGPSGVPSDSGAASVPAPAPAPGQVASGARIVLFRRPLLARAEDEEELSELIFDVIVEEFAEILGVDPDSIDPGYGDSGGFGGFGLEE